MDVLHHLHFETRRDVDPQGERWALFSKDSSRRIATGTLLRLTYRPSRTTPAAASFTGVLLGVRRSSGDPTIIVRGVIDGVGVEQIFCVFSPLLEEIRVLKAAAGKGTRKLYRLREHPAEILKLQKAAIEGHLSGAPPATRSKK